MGCDAPFCSGQADSVVVRRMEVSDVGREEGKVDDAKMTSRWRVEDGSIA